MQDSLPSWKNTPTLQHIAAFITAATDEAGANYVPPSERIATFDNDGTLWCERPFLNLLVRHDDPQREYAYDASAEKVQQAAQTHGWTTISMKNDWSTVF